MTVSYTTNFNFPKADDGCENWMAIWNGIADDIDRLLAEARDPLIWDDDGGDYLLDGLSVNKTTTEVLTYNGEVLLYA